MLDNGQEPFVMYRCVACDWSSTSERKMWTRRANCPCLTCPLKSHHDEDERRQQAEEDTDMRDNGESADGRDNPLPQCAQ